MISVKDSDLWIRELFAAGWKKHSAMTVWIAPWGALFRGPYLAWRVMRETTGVSNEDDAR